MDSVELRNTINPCTDEFRGILIALLSAEGYESFMETDTGVNAYISVNNFDIKTIRNLKEKKLPFQITSNFIRIADENWNEIWEKNYFKPIVIKNDLVVRASFHKDFPKCKQEIIIDPKQAFGTGNHSTTLGILKEILKLNLSGKKILDLGCGTGILSILSIKNGCKKAVAIDNDINACNNAKENIPINEVRGIKVIHGTSKNLNDEMFDVIYENIWKNIVIADLPILYKHTNKGGKVFLSGFYTTDAKDVIKAGEKVGYKFVAQREEGEWAVLIFKK